jgi:cell division protein FtsI/penicillin-binding protein 2
MRPDYNQKSPNTLIRVRTWYIVLIGIFGLIILRLFYLQVIRHEYYSSAALLGQYKEYEIAPERGVIEAHDGDRIVPIVLNEKKYTLFIDPKYVKDIPDTADRIQKVIGGSSEEFAKKMDNDSRYVVIQKKLSSQIAKKIDDLQILGVGTRAESYRTYPQRNFASQILGFVNDEGQGKYGIEQALDSKLKGTPGQLKAITDAKGVPLVANEDNVITQPKEGDRIVLSIDISMQQQLEQLLKDGLANARSKSGSVLIMDPKSGKIKAMANYPGYDPSKFSSVKDISVFNNEVVSSPLEVGSIMKPLTAAAALDKGSVKPSQTYYDPSFFKVDNETITNIEEDGGAGTRSVSDILTLSLNTGATWLLMQMGGGVINEQARNAWHDYMVNHYQLGKKTNIEQGYEEPGYIPDPKKGYGLNIQYANTAFGQGMSATPLQMGSALSSVVNGGTYFKPTLVDKTIDSEGVAKDNKPVVVEKKVVSPAVSKSMVKLLEAVVTKNYQLYKMKQLRPNYSIGGKTGTAQITKPEGGYYEDRFNGMFMGFVGGDNPEYVIVVRVNEPGISGYAGSQAAAPIFSSTVDMLINNFAVSPRS